MSAVKNSDTLVAIESLSILMKHLERKSGIIEDHIAEMNIERKNFLTKSAANLLSDINNTVFKYLNENHPGFISQEIKEAFASNGKFLGIFCGSRYKSILMMLRTRFACYLDETKFGYLKGLDIKINDRSFIYEDLQLKLKDAGDLLRLLKKSSKDNVPLPEIAREAVGKVAELHRSRKDNKPNSQSSRHRDEGSANDYDDETYLDLMIYVGTGFPTSTRTLMIEAILSSEESSSEPVRRNETSRDPHSYSTDDSFGGHNDTQHSTSDAFGGSGVAMAAGAGIASVGVGAAVVEAGSAFSSPSSESGAIATDDSLGMYS